MARPRQRIHRRQRGLNARLVVRPRACPAESQAGHWRPCDDIAETGSPLLKKQKGEPRDGAERQREAIILSLANTRTLACYSDELAAPAKPSDLIDAASFRLARAPPSEPARATSALLSIGLVVRFVEKSNASNKSSIRGDSSERKIARLATGFGDVAAAISERIELQLRSMNLIKEAWSHSCG